MIDLIYPGFVANVASIMDVRLGLPLSALMYCSMILIYIVISEVLIFKIRRITPAEVLKNRE